MNTSTANSIASNGSVRSQQSHLRNIQLQLQRLEEERALNEEQARLQREYLNKKYQLLEEADDISSASSNRSQSVRNWLSELPFQTQNTRFPEEPNITTSMPHQESLPNETSYLELPRRIAEQNNSNNDNTCCNANQTTPNLDMSHSPSTHNNPYPPITTAALSSATANSGNQRRSHIYTQPPSQPPVAVTFSNIPSARYYNSSVPPPPLIENTLTGNLPGEQTFVNNAPISSTMNAYTNNSQYLNNTLLHQFSNSARQSVPKELPVFSGNPEDWPLFISTFEWSTATCCFTDAENLIRLQRSLKSDALHSVRHMLVHPSNVPGNRINLSLKVDDNNLQTLTNFAINVRSLIAPIKAANLPDELNNSCLLHQLLQKLPPTYQMQWATLKMQLVKENKKPNLSAFDDWLFNIGLTASSISEPTTKKYNNTSSIKHNITSNDKPTTSKRAYVHSHNGEHRYCVCNKNCKAVSDCPKYQALDRGEKWKLVRANKLCKYCLITHGGECRKKKLCGKEGCQYYHHPSLHRFSHVVNTENGETSNANEECVNNSHIVIEGEEAVHNSHSEKAQNILFKIIPIKVYGKDKIIETFAFIDEGSSITLMDKSIANELKLEGVPNPLCLRWTGGMGREEKSSMKIMIEISGENGRRVKLNICTVESLNLPAQSLDYGKLSQRYRHLRQLPIKSYEDAVPKLLIGLNHFDLGVSNQIREGAQHEPVAVRTKLGWLIYGTMAEPENTRPDLMASLPAVLFKFRQNAVAICGDIEEMFHQVHIRPEDRDVQRFLWRDCDQNREPDVQIYQTKPLRDDLLDSVENPADAIRLITEVSYIHRQAGFNIRNWVSNSGLVKKAIPSMVSDGAKCINLKEETQVEKVLGVFWEPQEDVITFKVAPWLIESNLFSLMKTPTKREMLRLVMSIYDPLGLIGHIIMYVKVLMQDVWRAKTNWDEPIPNELVQKWTQWVKILPDIQKIKIPRCYLKDLHNYDGVEIQLHTFVDAIGAKTRVAPMKITSVPRLELMAALIGARFAKFITENHELKISKKYFWCDSKTVLSWINSNHRKYQQFVAFRITEILDLSSTKEWNWVPSKLNVADDATKWSRIPQISSCSRWFSGPEFIFQHEDHWPHMETDLIDTEVERIQHVCQTTHYEPLFNTLRFSKWSRLLRAEGFVQRFIRNCRGREKRMGELTQEDLMEAERLLYRQAQRENYSKEMSSLESNNPISKSSDIYSKSPYLENGILHVDGRIDMADVPLPQKRPVILPRENHITKLIFLHYHNKFCHMNNETVINELRQKFSISKLLATYKSTIRSCQQCKINKAKPTNPQMAKLPRARLASYSAPFAFTGLDFFGPILVTVNRHKEKRYGCLFTCLTIRAVHIEVAHSLTTNSCILAIRNFMARRGIPLEFYSDNGTNFIGAERELREAILEVDRNEIMKTFTTPTTKWIFNPPASPHMGGAWERLVRSVKTILYKTMPSRHPTDELLLNMLIEVENIINSRPLAYVPVEEDNAEAITPNHFLVGSSSGMKPLSMCDDRGIVLRQNWLTSQQYGNIFWKKWLAEYLPSNVWLRGRVLETRLARDGQVRSAKVQTQRGIMERPATKLAILDVALEKESGSEKVSSHTAGGMLALQPKAP
ncbi:uncharacterized protein LOC142231235 [Haematobia irritans]|uniref:uncharacterized protein LOC142231235 n=1 Tax=Haematobia irritans TaxID=7368 RepID=UPI003F5019A8